MHPANYKTLAGLLKKVEKVLISKKSAEKISFDGMSAAFWIQNALYAAESNFNNRNAVADLVSKYSVTRRQDLVGGDYVFGVKLPTRNYIAGDNIPGVGEIEEVFEDQYKVSGEWFHKRCFEQAD